MKRLSKKPSFKETDARSVITEFGLALAAVRKDVWHPSGTAIVIGQYLAVTAKHTIKDYWNKYESTPFVEGKALAGSFAICAFQILNEGKTGAIWSVTKIWFSAHTDIAFLKLTPSSHAAANYRWRIARMNLLPPNVGARIAAFGYHSSSIKINKTEQGVQVLWKDSPTTSIGEVIEVYEKCRDSSMLPFPSFRTNARFDPGMSGGPVVNEEGELCGIICSGTTFSGNEDGHISYVASLWPSMSTELDIDRKGFPKGMRYPALDLAKYGLIHARNWEKVVISKEKSQVGLIKNNP